MLNEIYIEPLKQPNRPPMSCCSSEKLVFPSWQEGSKENRKAVKKIMVQREA